MIREYASQIPSDKAEDCRQYCYHSGFQDGHSTCLDQINRKPGNEKKRIEIAKEGQERYKQQWTKEGRQTFCEQLKDFMVDVIKNDGIPRVNAPYLREVNNK